MATRKLYSCIAYSIRLASKEGQTDTAKCLWDALHGLTQDNKLERQPISLFSALNLTESQQPVSPAAVLLGLVSAAKNTGTQTSDVMITQAECVGLLEGVMQQAQESVCGLVK